MKMFSRLCFKYKLNRNYVKHFKIIMNGNGKKGIFFINTFILKYTSPKIKKNLKNIWLLTCN